MATVASLVANPILLRPKFHPLRIGATYNRFNHRFIAFSVRASNFNVVGGRPKKTWSRHHQPPPPPPPIADANSNGCGIRRDDLGIGIGKPHGRMGGKWYPYYRASVLSDKDGYIISVLLCCSYVLLCLPLRTFIKALGVIMCVGYTAMSCRQDNKTSVVKLQVGFSGKIGECLGIDLSQIAEAADTSTNGGLTNVFHETIVSLLRYYDYSSSSHISVVSKWGIEEANAHVNDLSIEERIKNREALVSVNNLQMQNPTSPNDFQNDDLMVTLLVGARVKLAFPTICNKYDFENVLHKLSQIASYDHITAIEVLWTSHVSSCSPRTSM